MKMLSRSFFKTHSRKQSSLYGKCQRVAPVDVASVDVTPDISSDEDTYTPDVDAEIIIKEYHTIVYNQLVNGGLLEHLTGTFGGTKSVPSASTIVSRIAKMLLWTHYQKYQKEVPAEKALEWLKQIVESEHCLLAPYCKYLESEKDFAPGTIQNYMDDISSVVKWVCIYCSLGSTQVEFFRIQETLSQIRRSFAAKKRHLRSQTSYNDTLIGNLQLPQNGLMELQEAVRGKMVSVKDSMEKVMDEKIYRNFMQLLYAALYVFAPQGRISGK